MMQKQIHVDSKAEYTIRVSGYLDESWSERLGGLAIHAHEIAVRKPETTLTGPLVDQAALLGVLNTLYNLRLPLILVECLSVKDE